jgi:hypothetical protein
MLGTLAVRQGRFAPGAGTEHALSQFAGTSREASDPFLTNLGRIARDDAPHRHAPMDISHLYAQAERRITRALPRWLPRPKRPRRLAYILECPMTSP